MPGKLALKRLTDSDLTLFEWHFRNHEAGNQKSINLNRNVFIDVLFPALPGISEGQGGRVPLDLHIFGPGLHGDHNLQRKIIKTGAYKNWRLNGEFIFNPNDAPERYNCLVAGDFVLIEFLGDLCPTMARAYFVAKGIQEDSDLHRKLAVFIGQSSMTVLSHEDLKRVIVSAAPPEAHPIHELMLEESLEDAAYSGLEGIRRLIRRRSGSQMSMEALLQAREAAERVGREGEELLNAFFESQKGAGEIKDFTWISNENAVAPYDFELIENDGSLCRLDVKSTTGEFGRKVHVSIAELHDMVANGGRYDLYRLYSLQGREAKLRICRDLALFARGVLDVFAGLPSGVVPDSVSVAPETFVFEAEQRVCFPVEEE